jgi:hypothetical protein
MFQMKKGFRGLGNRAFKKVLRDYTRRLIQDVFVGIFTFAEDVFWKRLEISCQNRLGESK